MLDLALDFSLGAFVAAFFVFKATLLVSAMRGDQRKQVPAPARSARRGPRR